MAVVAVVAAITAFVVAVAPGPATTATEADLALHGRAPTSLVATYSVSDGQYDVTGRVRVDFTTRTVAGTVNVPGFISVDSASFVLTATALYLDEPTVGSIVGAPWVDVATPRAGDGFAALARLLESTRTRVMTAPRALGGESVTRAGTVTRFRFHNPRAHVLLPPGVPLRLPSAVDLTTTVTVGSSGQFAAGSVTASAPGFDYGLAITVQDYDHPVTIEVPPRDAVRPLTPALRRRIFGTTSGLINELLTPAVLADLLRVRVT